VSEICRSRDNLILKPKRFHNPIAGLELRKVTIVFFKDAGGTDREIRLDGIIAGYALMQAMRYCRARDEQFMLEILSDFCDIFNTVRNTRFIT